MDYQIRKTRENEYSILSEFLYEAIFIQEGTEKPPKSILNSQNFKYISLILKKQMIGAGGAVWVRIMNDYGHIDNKTPSLAISLYEEYRNLGLGTELMKAMLQVLKNKGYKQVSLSVQKANYAVNMYRKLGFETVKENGEEYIMVCQL